VQPEAPPAAGSHRPGLFLGDARAIQLVAIEHEENVMNGFSVTDERPTSEKQLR
jgi:hypothetical protein